MSDRLSCSIAPATAAEMPLVRDLFEEYQRWLGFSLCFQGFEAELAALPGDYALPQGGLWLARKGDDVSGVVGLRALKGEAGRAELKRLWVRPAGRGLGLGRRLTETALREAERLGYEAVVLDTLMRMEQARALYQTMGFVPRKAFGPTTSLELLYLEKKL